LSICSKLRFCVSQLAAGVYQNLCFDFLHACLDFGIDIFGVCL